jgi:hypothetical protein
VKVVKRTPITRAFADYEVTIDGRAVDAVRTVIPVTEVQAAE